MIFRLLLAFLLGGFVGAGSLFAVAQYVAGDTEPSVLAPTVTATPTHVYEKYFGGPLGTVEPSRPVYSAPKPLVPAVIRTPTPIARYFIPYGGNGGGPTLCRDGMWSHSSGRGTCSGHGGVAH